jgi:hypothetical protein
MAKPALSEIKEADASGRTAALYDDIRAVIGVPMVNLIFRHMATIPGCLEWAWLTVRPLYLSGQIPDAATALTRGTLSDVSIDLGPARTAARLTPSDLDAVDRVLVAYGLANPMNLIGLKVIGLALDNAKQDDGVGTAPPVPEERLLRPEGQMALPDMADPKSAAEPVRQALHNLAVQIHGGDTGVIPSLYRHFGAWPKFLEELHRALAPLFAGDQFEAAAAEMREKGERYAMAFYRALTRPDLPPPDTQTVITLKGLIEQFPPNICRMTVLATVIRRGLVQK